MNVFDSEGMSRWQGVKKEVTIQYTGMGKDTETHWMIDVCHRLLFCVILILTVL